MQKRLASFWKNYKFRFVPWIVFNLKDKKTQLPKGNGPTHNQTASKSENVVKIHGQNVKVEDLNPTSSSSPAPGMIVHHVREGDDKLLSDKELLLVMIRLFNEFLAVEKKYAGKHTKNAKVDISKGNLEAMQNVLGYSIERRKSLVSEDAGTGVFLASGRAKPGSLIALYPGTIYTPSEPLFFPSIGNPFIFRCSDGLHIDGNDKWISKSIFKSCTARDKFRIDLPCCDDSWLGGSPLNPLNIGQYVNNRSKSSENNVVYQEAEITIGLESDRGRNNTLPVHLCRFLPNVWSNPENNHHPLRIVPLVAVKGIKEGEEILSSYFTVVHSKAKQ